MKNICYQKLAANLAVLSLLNFFSIQAKSEETVFLIFGPALTSEYQGSDDYSIVPMIVSEFSIYDVGFEIEGLTFRSKNYTSENWQIGLNIELDTGRNNDVENAKVASFEELDLSINFGGYVAYYQKNQFISGDEIEYIFSVFSDTSSVHSGYYLTTGITYTLPMLIPFRVEFELESTYANSDYMDTYFGVNTENAIRSDLLEYTADASLRDITFNTNIGLFANSKWGAFLRLGVTKLIGDAKKSPIVLDGSDTQYFSGLGVFYRFGE